MLMVNQQDDIFGNIFNCLDENVSTDKNIDECDEKNK